MRLSYHDADLSKIEMIKKEFAKIIYFSDDIKHIPFLHCPLPLTTFGINLRNLQSHWSARDEKGITHKGTVQIWDWLYDFILTESGFSKIPSRKSGAGFPSEVTYTAIVDPTKGSNDQTYPISHKIAPGDVERFHILIGSPISCRLLLKFKFLVDKTQSVESEIFDLHIWNPRNSAWHYVYKDGTALRRDLEKQQNSITEKNGLSGYEVEEAKLLEQRLKQKAIYYPFLPED